MIIERGKIMRIWSKDLIPVLPNKQLKAMRYELGDMIKQYPNIKNPLVKFANNYGIEYLGQYFLLVCQQCIERNINTKASYDNSILEIVMSNTRYDDEIYWKNYTFKEDNNRYLKQCYYNLQEKYDRGIITKEEWQKIEDLVGNEIESVIECNLKIEDLIEKRGVNDEKN